MEELKQLLMENPEIMVAFVKEYVNKYKPTVYALAQEVVEIYKDYSNNTEYPAIVAKTKKNLYDAYVEVGFTEDQALALMINDNIQLIKKIKNLSSSASINKKN